MSRARTLWLLVAVLLVPVVWYVATSTSWEDVKMPMPLTGEARVNPFYAAQRFAEALGARTSWDRMLTIPPTDSVIVLSGWHWSRSNRQRDALERWVESGGRLVVDATLAGTAAFERWSGVVREYREEDGTTDPVEPTGADPCHAFDEDPDGVRPVDSSGRHWLCDFDADSFLRSSRPANWALRDASGVQAIRVPVGRGSVTVINAVPFRFRALFDGDHAWLLVAATELRRGDDVHFVSDEDHPSLLALLWQHGAPVIVLALMSIGLAVWRGGVRLGPLAVSAPPGRRSLGDQIRGTGQFALRYGGAESLHSSCVRALERAVERRISGYVQLPSMERARALGRLTGFEPKALALAMYQPRSWRHDELGTTIVLLERARRRAISHHTRNPR